MGKIKCVEECGTKAGLLVFVVFLWAVAGTVWVLAATGLAPTIRADGAALWVVTCSIVLVAITYFVLPIERADRGRQGKGRGVRRT